MTWIAMRRQACSLSLVAVFAALATATQPSARADTFGSGVNIFAIDFVDIGKAGNSADTTGYGAVPYPYRIGKFEVTEDAIAAAAAGGLANVAAGAWTGNQPAANISWYEAAAFVNWLNTSKGYQAAYKLIFTNGSWTMQPWSSANAWTLGGTNLYRHKDAVYFLPNENEWYKAAYYNPAASRYSLYPTLTGDSYVPVKSGRATNNVVVRDADPSEPALVLNSGGVNSYGTVAQGGNVWEWMEGSVDGTNNSGDERRVYRGGAWDYWGHGVMPSSYSLREDPDFQTSNLGFRVASVSIPLARRPQNISFAQPAGQIYAPGGTFPLSASNSSGRLVSFVSGNTNLLTILGNTALIRGAGIVPITATNTGDANFLPGGAARNVTIAKASQSIRPFAATNNVPVGAAVTFTNNVSTAGLPVSFSLVSGPATVSGGRAMVTGVGTVVVRATQGGNANYNAATPLTNSFATVKGAQSIRPFAAINNVPSGAVVIFTNTNSTAELPVTFQRVSGPATVSGNRATVTGAGTVIVRAIQNGNINYNAAVPRTNRFTTVKGAQSIRPFAATNNVPVGAVVTFTNTNSTAGLPVSFSLVSGPATVSGNRATVTGVGTVVVRATQGGNASYNAAAPLTNSFTTVAASNFNYRWVWVQRIDSGPSTDATATALAVGADGLWIGGQFSDQHYIQKLSLEGQTLTQRILLGKGDSVNGLVMGAAGELFGAADIWTSVPLSTRPGLFFARRADGTIIRTRLGTSTANGTVGYADAYGIDRFGSWVYVTGYLAPDLLGASRMAYFGDQAFSLLGANLPANAYAAFLTKINAGTGEVAWARFLQADFGDSVKAASDGRIYVAGANFDWDGPGFLRCVSEDGSILWANQTDSFVNSLALDTGGDVWVSNRFAGTLQKFARNGGGSNLRVSLPGAISSLAVAAHPSGGTVALSHGQQGFRLHRVEANGTVAWSKLISGGLAFRGNWSKVFVAQRGDIYVAFSAARRNDYDHGSNTGALFDRVAFEGFQQAFPFAAGDEASKGFVALLRNFPTGE